MNRRSFVLGLLALPVIGPALAGVAQRAPEWKGRLWYSGSDLPEFGTAAWRNHVIAATIETRSQQIADNVCKNNLLLRHVERDWTEMRSFDLGDEVYLHGKVLVCVRAGTTSKKRIARGVAFLGDYAVVRPDGQVLIGEYLSDTTIWHHDHARHLIRQMRSEQRARWRRAERAWPFDNGLARA